MLYIQYFYIVIKKFAKLSLLSLIRLFFVCGLVYSPVFAAQKFDATAYIRIKDALADNQPLDNYPQAKQSILYPYLAFDYYQDKLESPDIVNLFPLYQQSPIIKNLFNKWLLNQYNDASYQNVIDYYNNYKYLANQSATCAYKSSLLQTGNSASALDNVDVIMLAANNISNYCRPIFVAWSKAADKKSLQKVIINSFNNRNFGYSAELAQFLKASDVNTMKKLINLAKNPEKLLNYSPSEILSKSTNISLTKALLPTVLAELARKNSANYASYIISYQKILDNNQDYQNTIDKLVGYLANRQDEQTLEIYQLLDKPSANTYQGFVRYLVVQKKWDELIKFATSGKLKPENNIMEKYWLARAYEYKNQNKKAKNIYQEIAKNRDYYGFLAADKLDKAYQFNSQTIKLDNKIQTKLDNNLNLISALALQQVYDFDDARNEILAAINNYSDDTATQVQLAYWLNSKKFYFEAIYLLGKLKKWDYLDIRFPTPYDSFVKQTALANKLDYSLIYAVIRQESSMNPYAISRTNAKGLMQIMPKTAKEIAKSTNSALDYQLFDSETNIKMGGVYLANLLAQFNNVVYTIASYNAGTSRINKWADANTMDIWIESIPFNETRDYVKKILEYQQVYAKLTGNKTKRLSLWLAPQ